MYMPCIMASLCYSLGEGGLKKDLQRARQWMIRAADSGHGKTQLEHGSRSF